MAAFETHRDSDAAADMLTEQEAGHGCARDGAARDQGTADQGRRGHVGSNWFLTMVSTLLFRSRSPVQALLGGGCCLPWLHGAARLLGDAVASLGVKREEVTNSLEPFPERRVGNSPSFE